MKSLISGASIPLVMTLILLSPTPARAAVTYTITDLGTLGGGSHTEAYGINELVQVVDGSSTAGGDYHAFLWTPGAGMIDLDTLGSSISWAQGLNDLGQVVGQYGSGATGGPRAFLWESPAGMVDLGTLGGDIAIAHDINNLAQVVGYSMDMGGSQHAFLWEQGIGMTDLTAFVNTYAINDSGQVAGFGGAGQGVWSAGSGTTYLDMFEISVPRDINEAGDVVGDPLGNSMDATLWIAQTDQYIGLAGIHAYRINDARDAVGYSRTVTDFTARLWTEADGLLDLNDLLDDPADAAAWTLEWARDINNSGQIVGSGLFEGQSRAFLLTPIPEPATVGFLLAGMLLLVRRKRRSGALASVGLFVLAGVIGLGATSAYCAVTYTITDLGTLGGPSSNAMAINELGQVAGWSETPGGDEHAFFWTPGSGMTDLSTLGGADSCAQDINDTGQVVGWSDDTSSLSRAFLWSEGTGMTDIGTLGGDLAMAYGINNLGQVVGSGNKTIPEPGEPRFLKPFLWEQAVGMTDLEAIGGPHNPRAINDAGQIIGTDVDTAVVWSSGSGMTTVCWGPVALPRDINEAGDVVGEYSFGWNAFIWTEQGGTVDLGDLGAPATIAYGINSARQVVGFSGNHAFLWTQAEAMLDLNDLLDDPSDAAAWMLERACDINNSGLIVGWGEHNGQTRAFLLTPIPEPATVVLIGIGSLLLIRRRRR